MQASSDMPPGLDQGPGCRRGVATPPGRGDPRQSRPARPRAPWRDHGRRAHSPAFLARAPAEEPDIDLADFHRGSLGVLADPALRTGEWALAETSGWPGNDWSGDLVAWSWRGDAGRWLIVVNLGDATVAADVAVGWDDLRGRETGTWPIPRPASPSTAGATTWSTACTSSWGPWRWHVLRIE